MMAALRHFYPKMAAPWDKESLCKAIKEDPAFCLECPSLAADILTRRLALVQLVEYLKDLLTDPEPSQRAQGILVLSSVLKELPPDFLREDEVCFIVTFFCDRLKDHHDVIPAALKGILSIIRMKLFAKELPPQVLNTLMLNISCQSQRQEDRLNIYRILDALVIPHLEDLKGLGPDLVYHIISSIDGERDPRNLKFLFSMLPPILRSLSLGHLTEDFFEVIACYFPVDFKPAAADPNQVTRESLASGLSDCLTAVPAFAEFCIPLLLEKLDSSLQLAKVDSLFLLKKCCEKFHPEDISVHLSPIWMSLSREALSGSDYEIRQSARETVTLLLRSFADMPLDSTGQSDPMKLLLGDVISASASALTEVQTSLFMPASELLLAAAKSCTVACKQIFTQVYPIIMDNFDAKPELTDKSIFLRTMSRFLTVCKSLNVTPQSIDDITTQWNRLVELFFIAALHEASLVRKEALYGITILTSTLNAEQSTNLYILLCDIVDGENDVEVRKQCNLCLLEAGNCLNPSLVLTRLNISDIEKGDLIFQRRLEALCCLSAAESFTHHILPKVVDLIVLSSDVQQVHVALLSLRNLLEKSEPKYNFVFDCLHQQCKLVQRLLKWWVFDFKYEGDSSSDLLENVCYVISNVTRNLNELEQLSLVQPIVLQFYPGSESFDPWNGPEDHRRAVALLEAVLGCLHRNVVVPNRHELCCSLVKLSIEEGCIPVSITSGRLCASLINKLPEEEQLQAILADVSTMLDKAHASNVSILGGDPSQNAASLYGWIIKGLAMRGYEHLEHWIDKLVRILEDERPSVALSAAKAFQTIMAESPLYLNSQNHCVVRLLYRQRVFVGAMKLLSKSKMAPVEKRNAYHMALVYLLTDVPQSVSASYMGEVLPVLLETLLQGDTSTVEAVLLTLHGFLVQSVYSSILTDHIQTMLPRLLQMTDKKSITIRIRAFNCLADLCNLPFEYLLPFKDEVTFKLAACRDDSKRLARRCAVTALTRWNMMAP